jgi:hypothetical protein
MLVKAADEEEMIWFALSPDIDFIVPKSFLAHGAAHVASFVCAHISELPQPVLCESC